ncbi:hypothetical protein LINGRAHAP2_LOCUS4886 [Linum grandiflorum]
MMDAADKERMYTFLMGLNETYTAIRSHILSVQPTPTLAQAYNMVADNEQQREISGSSKSSYEAMVLQTTMLQGSQLGFLPDKSKVRCPVCRRTGHTWEECFVVIGYPDWWKGRIMTAGDSTPRPTRATQVVTTDVVSQLNGIQVISSLNSWH